MVSAVLRGKGLMELQKTHIWFIYCTVVRYWLFQTYVSFTESLGGINLVPTSWTVAKVSIVL